MRYLRFLFVFAALGPRLAGAQGGPPMATDDPGTPGDGHWEINVAGVGTHTPNAWNVDAPDADINYGWGEHIQLNADIPWTYTNAEGGHLRSGLGDSSFGVKWRFLDKNDAHPFSMSIYPRFQTSLSGYSERIGVASRNKAFFFPAEIAAELSGLEIAADLGRHFVQQEADFWSAGIVVGHSCGSDRVECLVEVHREWKRGDPQTLLNFGLRRKLNDSMTVLAALGKEFGARSEDQASALIYLGMQISR
jgi:hypothetical protein